MVRRTRRLAGRMLTFLLHAEDDTLREFAAAAKSGRAAKTLVKQGAQRITLVALKNGAALPPHRVAGAVSVQTIHGCLKVGAGHREVEIPEGSLVAFGPGVAHTVRALGDASILITVAMP
jgi:quercetin dioxygenase-like cupin family protein